MLEKRHVRRGYEFVPPRHSEHRKTNVPVSGRWKYYREGINRTTPELSRNAAVGQPSHIP